MNEPPTAAGCTCRYPGLGGDCDGSCTHPPPLPQSTDLRDLFRPKSTGVVVNPCVRPHVAQPELDYKAMRRLFYGEPDAR